MHMKSAHRHFFKIGPNKYSDHEYVRLRYYVCPDGGESHTIVTVNENGATKEISVSNKAMNLLCEMWFKEYGHA